MKKLLMVCILIVSILNANIDEAKKAFYDKNFDIALSMFEELKKEGNIESNYYLGVMYYVPFGVKKNYEKAFEYITISTSLPNKRNLKVAVNMALMYIDGKETKQDYLKAFSLLNIADKEDMGFAQNVLGMLYEKGKGVEKNALKALEYYKKACKNHFSKSCYYSGDYYKKGIGVENSYSIAKTYYEKGCDLGLEASCVEVKSFPEEKNFFEKYYLYIVVIGLLIGWFRSWKAKKKLIQVAEEN